MSSSKLTSKYQATIPEDVRTSLKLQPGDTIAFYVTQEGTVILKKAQSLDKAYLHALNSTLSEWESSADEDAYGNL
jgi:antitoxin PrlF